MKKMVLMIVCCLLLVSGMAQATPIITNGSFESGTDPGSFATLGTGSPDITGWTVGGSIDYIGRYWQAANGSSRSLDMNGLWAVGSVSQQFITVAGQAYQVTFALAGNPDGSPTQKDLRASVTSGTTTVKEFSFNDAGMSRSNMGWVDRTFSFIAGETLSTLLFESLNTAPVPGGAGPNSAFGPALDDVRVTPVPEPGTLVLLGAGLFGLAVYGKRRKNW